ncbi:MAG: septum formation family protein [Nocardioidaceae bacterium]
MILSRRVMPSRAHRPHRRVERRALMVAVGVAAALGVALAGCSGSEDKAETTEPMVRAGDCFGKDDTEPIDCSERHLAQTIFVSDTAPARGTAALKPCRGAQAGYLGQDFNSRLDVRLWVAGDGSWYRCDLVLRNSTQGGSGYATMIGSLEGAFRTGVPLYLRACLDAPYDPLLDQEYVSCSEPHRSREITVAPAIGTLDEPFPGDVSKRAISACNATATSGDELGSGRRVDAYYPENVDAWESGERTADCWLSVKRGRLPAVSPGS